MTAGKNGNAAIKGDLKRIGSPRVPIRMWRILSALRAESTVQDILSQKEQTKLEAPLPAGKLYGKDSP